MAQQTNHTTDYVWNRMAYAQGLQYRTIWLQDQGYELETATATPTLKSVIT